MHGCWLGRGTEDGRGLRVFVHVPVEPGIRVYLVAGLAGWREPEPSTVKFRTRELTLVWAALCNGVS